MKTLVIVPAYNEEGNIASVIAELRANGVADILVVNDGSTDRTSEIAHATGAMVADLPLNLGIGGAVQTGLIFAQEQGYEAAAQFDGDGQHRADQIGLIVGPIMRGEADLVVGSRFMESTGGGYKVPLARNLGIRVLRATLGGEFTDPTSGFRAFGKRAILRFSASYPEDYPEVEVLAETRKLGLRGMEVQVKMRQRAWGKSSIMPVYYMVKVLLALAVRAGRRS